MFGLKHILVVLFFLNGGLSYALSQQKITVRLFSETKIEEFLFTPSDGSYILYGDGIRLLECDSSTVVQLKIEDGCIGIRTLNRQLGRYSNVSLVENSSSTKFKIRLTAPLSELREYEGGLELSLNDFGNEIQMLNLVGIEYYVGGVVESESGTWNNSEYYKLQSILCRTYLLSNTHRHLVEGYDVCDKVHCQVYHHKATAKKIQDAVKSTKGLVLVDKDVDLVTAVFHSNCGGQTCNSEDVWSSSKSYLQTVKDPYCVKKSNANWKKEIPLYKWNKYMHSKNPAYQNTPVSDWNLNKIRLLDYTTAQDTIPLTTMRSDLRLKSTLFSIRQSGNLVVLEGRGYGHGVGLCQEGAMVMSKMSFTYLDILRHYYKHVGVANYNDYLYLTED